MPVSRMVTRGGNLASASVQQSRFSFLGILRAVEDRIDNDTPRLNLVEDHIWESTDKSTPVTGEHRRIHFWVSLNGDDRCLNTAYELQAQPGTLPLIPGKTVSDILSGRREKVRFFSPSTQGSTS